MVQIRYDPNKKLFHCLECGNVDSCGCVSDEVIGPDPICECGKVAWECDCYEREQRYREMNGCECLHGPCLCPAQLDENVFQDSFQEWLLSLTATAKIEVVQYNQNEGLNDAGNHTTNLGV